MFLHPSLDFPLPFSYSTIGSLLVQHVFARCNSRKHALEDFTHLCLGLQFNESNTPVKAQLGRELGLYNTFNKTGSNFKSAKILGQDKNQIKYWVRKFNDNDFRSKQLGGDKRSDE